MCGNENTLNFRARRKGENKGYDRNIELFTWAESIFKLSVAVSTAAATVTAKALKTVLPLPLVQSILIYPFKVKWSLVLSILFIVVSVFKTLKNDILYDKTLDLTLPDALVYCGHKCKL